MFQKLISFIIGGKEADGKKKYFWYTLGSGFFALSTLVMTIVVSRFMGESIGGMFSLGLSVAQWLTTIAYFEIRTYQVTDVNNEHGFTEYLGVRIILCLLTFLICLGYVFLNGYGTTKAGVVILVCIYKILEGAADVFEGEFQRNNRIDISGKSMFIRTAASMLAITLALGLTRNIMMSLVIMILIETVVIIITDICICREFTTVKISLEKKAFASIFVSCFPLAVCTFLSTYIVNSSKLSVDRVCGDRFQLYYTAVFMPNLVINLFSGIIFKPMQTQMARNYADGRYKEFVGVIRKLILTIMGFTLVCEIGAFLLGIPVLSLLYGVNLADYKLTLLILLLAGSINAINIILYYVLTIMRVQGLMIPVYLLASGISLLLLDPLTRKSGLNGAAAGYLIIVVLLAVMLTVCIFWKGRKRNVGTV